MQCKSVRSLRTGEPFAASGTPGDLTWREDFLASKLPDGSFTALAPPPTVGDANASLSSFTPAALASSARRVSFKVATLVHMRCLFTWLTMLPRHRRPPKKTALDWHSYASRQSDARQLRRQCSGTSSLELSNQIKSNSILFCAQKLARELVNFVYRT